MLFRLKSNKLFSDINLCDDNCIDQITKFKMHEYVKYRAIICFR